MPQPSGRQIPNGCLSRCHRRLREIVEPLRNRILKAYFELSYRLLDSPTGNALLESASEPGAPAVHGYTDLSDLHALINALEPRPGSGILDLGAGLGDVAIWLHQATGAHVIGIERSRRAVAAARRQAMATVPGGGVRFIVGDMMQGAPPGSAAYALDSLMFESRPAEAIAIAVRRLQPPARLLATVVVFGRSGCPSLLRSLQDQGLRVVQLEDVSGAMMARSSRRRSIAAQLAAALPRRIGGRGSLILVWVEETLMLGLARADLARRYRVVVEAGRAI